MNKKDEAVRLFNEGFNCSQVVLSVYAKELDLDTDLALKIASGFGGGSRNGELCGAVVGALMVLGIKDGHFIKGDSDRKIRSYGLAKEFTDKFKQAQGDLVCKNLLGYDLSKPEEYKILDEKGLFETECPKYIVGSIEILENLISSKTL